MQNLYRLTLGDVVTIAVGIAIGNALALLVFITLGFSALPESGFISTIFSFVIVVILLTLLPLIVVVFFVFISAQRSS